MANLVADLLRMPVDKAKEVSIPVMPTQRNVLESCKTCIFNNTKACNSIECWGHLSETIFRIA